MAGTVAITIIGKARDAIRAFNQTGDAAQKMERRVKAASRSSTKEINVFSTVLKVAASRAVLFGAGIAAAIPAIINIGRALAPLTGFLIALPAVVGGAAAALGVFKLAVSGVGDAISAGFSGDADKFTKALEKLPPAAQAFSKAVVGLKPAIDQLRNAVTTEFFKPLIDQIKPLANTYLPILKQLLPPIAAAIGNLGRQFATSARSSEAMNGIKAILENTKLALDALKPAIDPVVKAFGILASTGAPILVKMADAITVLATRFGAFIDNAEKTGKLQEWLDGAVRALTTLGGILKDIGSIFISLFKGLSGDGKNLLDLFKDITGQVAEFFDSAEGAAALKSVFQTLADIGTGVRIALGGILPAIGDALREIGPSLGPMAIALGKMLAAIAPILVPLAKIIAVIAEKLTPVITQVADNIGPIIDKISEFVDKNSSAIADVVIVVGAMVAAFGALAAIELPEVSAAVLAIGTAVAGIAAAFVLLWSNSEGFRDALSRTWDVLSEGAAGVWKAFTDLYNTVKPIVTQIIDFIQNKWAELEPKIRPILENLKTIIGQVFEGIQVGIENFTAFVSWVWDHFGQNMLTAISIAFEAIVGVIGGAVEIIKGILDVVIGIMTLDWKRIWDGAASIVTGAIDIAKAQLTALSSAVYGAVNYIGGLVFNMVNGLATGVHNGINNVLDAIRHLPGQIIIILANPGQWLYDTGRKIMDGLRRGIVDEAASVANAAANVVRSIISAAAAVGAAAAKLASGPGFGLGASLGKIVSGLPGSGTGIGKGIGNAIGKIGSDIGKGISDGVDKAKKAAATALADLAKFIGAGFIKGLTGTEATINSTMAALLKKVKTVFSGSTESTLVAMITRDNVALVKLARARDAIKDKLVAANDKLQDLIKARADVVTNVANTIRGAFKLVDDAANDGVTSMRAILAKSAIAVKRASEFAINLAKLRKAGLDPRMIQELADAGVTAGGATARAILRGTPAQLAALNKNYAEIAKVAGQAGNTVASSLYDAGIKAAQGLVDGLKNQQKAIEAQMLAIAISMQTAIKRALGIHSPSSVFRRLGEMTIKGFALGFGSSSLDLSKFNAPGYAARSGAMVVNNTVNVTVPLGADPAEVGRQIQSVLDEYASTYGR